MITIAFCNLKGGVGKTTACQNIAVALRSLGKKVAVVDMDPQSNLSASFGLTLSAVEPQVFDILSGNSTWDDVKVTREGIDIIPSSLNLILVELNPEDPVSKDNILKNVISSLDQSKYDFVLVDCPPQLSVFTRNALAACEHLIVPMDAGFFSLMGLKLLNEALPVFHDRLNIDINLLGILFTNFEQRIFMYREVRSEVKNFFGNKLFDNFIRKNVALVEASSLGKSIFTYAPKSNGAEDYVRVANELLEKLEGGERHAN